MFRLVSIHKLQQKARKKTYVCAASLERVRDTEGAADVLREAVARETIDGVVRELDDLLLGLELDDHRDGAEDLLAHDLHVRLGVREDRGLDEVAGVASLGATDLEGRALLLAGLDVAENTLKRAG